VLGHFFRPSTDRKQSVNEKENDQIDSLASGGGQAKYIKYGGFPLPEARSTFVKKTIS